jgi:DNA-directed RNA polymerase subunit beta'
VAQDAIISMEDCGTKDGVVIGRESALGLEVDMAKNIRGRYLAKDVAEEDGTVLFKKGHFLDTHDAQKIQESGVASVTVRSPMTCKALHGICVECYGADITNWKPVGLGEAVGTIAAQAIGEPGTQLTMNTKHAGGAAAVGGDVVQGLPRVEEVFERRIPKNPAVIATVAGVITDIREEGREKIVVVTPEVGQTKGNKNVEFIIAYPRMSIVTVGQKVEKGTFLSDGSADLAELYKYGGKEKTQDYIIGPLYWFNWAIETIRRIKRNY